MSLTKDVNNKIVETVPQNADRWYRTGVLEDIDFAVCDMSDALKQLRFSITPIPSGKTITVQGNSSQSGDIVVTWPATSGTLYTGGTAIETRVTTLEDKYVRTTRFASISSGTSGTVSLPASSTVVLDDFGGTTDAVISAISGGEPTFTPAFDSTGNVVAATFDGSGNYTLASVPTSYPVVILYRVRQKLKDFDSTSSDIVGIPNNSTATPLLRFKRTPTATSYTVLSTDELVAITSTAAARTMTVSPSVLVTGQAVWFKDESLACSVNNITITPSSGTIDGLSTYVMNIDGEMVGLYTDGTNCFVI